MRRPHHLLPARVRRLLFGLVRFAIGAAVLAYIISLVKLSAFRPLTRGDNALWLLLAVACLAANVYVAAWRWQLLLLALGVRERIAPLLRAIYVGAFYNLVLPGQLGGQAIKVLLVGRAKGIRSPALREILASVAMDQLIIIIALFILGLVAAAFAPPLAYRTGWLFGFGFTLVAAIVLLLVVIAPRLQPRLLRGVRRSRRLIWLPDGLRHQTSKTWASLAAYGREPVMLLVAIAQAVLFLITLGGMALGLARGLGIDLDFLTILFVLCVALIAGVAPFTLAGLGAREAAFTAAFVKFGVDKDVGAAFAVLWLILNVLADAMGGVMQFWHPRQAGTLERARPRRRGGP
ncbi:MAG: flippase-like domain-containing protein [Chloroflexi bacterium]|nr:MAG: flippase-like domain-containing protein [Chloroflexota bacterium]